MVYRLSDFPGRGETRSFKGFAAQDAKPDLDLIKPGGVGGGVVEVNVLVPGQPAVPFGFMGAEVIQDHVDFLVWISSHHLI